MRSYLFELECPQCGKLDQQVLDKSDEDITLFCGNCLMEQREIVAMKITSVTVQEDSND